MSLYACILSIVPLRAEPGHRSEMVSQVLFGEVFEIIEKGKDFDKVRLLDVDYEGWIQHGQYATCGEVSNSNNFVVGLQGALAKTDTRHIQLVPGTRVQKEMLIADNMYHIDGALRRPVLTDFETEFPKLIDYYKDAPYMWGGRSVTGIDCSGLSQVVYAYFGVQLQRDAWQQAESGMVVDFLSETSPGDLAFFDNEAGRIIHVGVIINNETILHASGKVRIDKIDNEGIFNKELNRYTHKLRIVKRYFKK